MKKKNLIIRKKDGSTLTIINERNKTKKKLDLSEKNKKNGVNSGKPRPIIETVDDLKNFINPKKITKKPSKKRHKRKSKDMLMRAIRVGSIG
jgi:hypothetical protein